MTDRLLADSVNRLTYERKFNGRRLSDRTIGVQLRIRQKLRQAQRFVVDDDSVKLVCHLSHELDRLEHWSFLARLPHDPLWIEFSLHEKVKEFNRMNALNFEFKPEEVAPKIGFLMYRDAPDTDSPRWVAQCFVGSDEERQIVSNKDMPEVEPGLRLECAPGLISYVFDPEGDPKAPIKGSLHWKLPTLSLVPDFPKMPIQIKARDTGRTFNLKADAEIAASGMYEMAGVDGIVSIAADLGLDGNFKVENDTGQFIRGPDWFMPRMAVIMDPWWVARKGPDVVRSKSKVFYNAILSQCREERGTLRYLITLLAAINGLPKTTKPVNPTKVRRMIGINNVPFFSHTNLSITIPGEDRLLRAKRTMDRETNQEVRRRRWHMVRGHWRVIEFGKRTHLCRHQPTMIEHGLGICEKCELLIRWIDAHEAGDQALGVVDKTYRITT